MKKLIGVVVAGLTITGCATSSSIVGTGPDTYLISRQAGTGFSGLGSLKADAFKEANEYCAKEGKKLRVEHTSESQPPYILGNFPRAEVEFMCLNSGDSELTRPKSVRDPASR